MSRLKKFVHRHLHQAAGIGRKAFAFGQKNDPLMKMGQGGGMFGMGGAPQQGATTIIEGGNPDDQARSDAAQAMKRQAGGGQISFTGNNETPASQAG